MTLLLPQPEAVVATTDAIQTYPCVAYRNASVLVVEDNRDLSTAITIRVSEEGYETYLAHDGVSGLESYLEHDPDCLVLDIGLPGMGGFKLLHEIRRHDPYVPTVIITGDRSLATARKLQGFGLPHIVHKPFKAEDLLEAIDDALAN